MEKKRSVGIIVIAVLCSLYSLLAVGSGLKGYIVSIEAIGIQANLYQRLSPLLIILVDFGFLFGGVGILRLKAWARKIILWVAALKIPISIVGGIQAAKGMKMLAEQGHPGYGTLKDANLAAFTFNFFLFGILPLIIFYLVIIFYLTRPKVKEQFR